MKAVLFYLIFLVTAVALTAGLLIRAQTDPTRYGSFWGSCAFTLVLCVRLIIELRRIR